MVEKRSLENASREQMTEAAQLNHRVLRKLEKAFASNPEVDLLSLFPATYSMRLASRKKITTDQNDIPSVLKTLQTQEDDNPATLRDDVRYFLSPDNVTTIDPLAGSVRELVESRMTSTNTTTIAETGAPFFTALIALIQNGEVVHSGPVPSRRMVVKCGVNTVVKLVWGAEDFTEYTTLQYLLEHKPSVPAPRPLGLLRMGPVSVMFSSYLLGPTLEAVWTDLDTSQKISIRDQLDAMLQELRTIQLPCGMSLGGVAGEGCKDQRRHLRRSTVPVSGVEDFESFQFSNPKYGSMIFIDFLRAFTSPSRNSCQVVFTHGDLRPANIIVQVTEGKRCSITGLVDWEDSGFYPEYHEATKTTNCLSTNEDSDWYRFLPPSVSPHSYPAEWLRDYVWGRHLE